MENDIFHHLGSSAILIGQFLGDWIQYKNIQMTTPDMTAEQQARLHLHHEFTIWFATVLLLIIISLLVHKHIKNNKNT